MVGNALFPLAQSSRTTRVVLALGSNVGDRWGNFWRARVAIGSRIGRVQRSSSVFETVPEGMDAWPALDEDCKFYLNMTLVVDTHLDAHDTLAKCLLIEEQLGRVRPSAQDVTAKSPPNPKSSKGSKNNTNDKTDADQAPERPIDIDIIFFGNQIIDEPDLCVPHPRYHHRKFVLVPLIDLSVDIQDPVSGRSPQQCLYAPEVRIQPEPRLVAAGW